MDGVTRFRGLRGVEWNIMAVCPTCGRLAEFSSKIFWISQPFPWACVPGFYRYKNPHASGGVSKRTVPLTCLVVSFVLLLLC
jgi:hypothetical protein